MEEVRVEQANIEEKPIRITLKGISFLASDYEIAVWLTRKQAGKLAAHINSTLQDMDITSKENAYQTH